MRYRLGLDLGTNSLGWCVLELNEQDRPVRLVKVGARIFRDGRVPSTQTSLAVARRIARQQRRRRDRYLKRRDRLMHQLIRYGLMPSRAEDRKRLQDLDPYQLRARGLLEELSLNELGRALFHINQRRGFKSNRKTDRPDDKETGKINPTIEQTSTAIKDGEFDTLGQYLYSRRKSDKPVRVRQSGARAEYEIYFDRSMTENELEKLWTAQSKFHPAELTDEIRDDIFDTILHQRPLRPVDPGRCTFEPSEKRAPRALPSYQRFRIYQELGNLRIIDPALEERPLTAAERDAVAAQLEVKEKVTWAGIRRILKLPRDTTFNLEDGKKKHLVGNQTSIAISKAEELQSWWQNLGWDEQDRVTNELVNASDDHLLALKLVEKFGIDLSFSEILSGVQLVAGYGRVGQTALKKILVKLKDDVITYAEAVRRAGYHHSDFYDGVIYDELPYYGEILERQVIGGTGDVEDSTESRYGKISNPTVHIGLNQIRKVVNALINKYGHPNQIIIELARDIKLNQEAKREILKFQKDNQDRNEKFAEDLKKLGEQNNYGNRLRLRLWEELSPNNPLARRCPYSGTQISLKKLFSNEVEIDHIIPFSQSLDDGIANKILCIRRSNRDKGQQTPYEAFGHSPAGYDWGDIASRASELPPRKRSRFGANARKEFLRDNKDFLARQLTDTAYLSRISREYLTAVCPKNCVWVTPGRLTAMLRHHWGLDSILSSSGEKTRSDHRHHAIDAFVIACTDRSILQKVASVDRQPGARLSGFPDPFSDYYDSLEAEIRRLCISYKPDHGVQGQLHNETAYGIVDGPDTAGRYEVVYRKAVVELSSSEIGKIRDAHWRALIKNAVGEKTKAELKKALAEFSASNEIRRIRLTGFLSVIPTPHDGQDAYKAYKGDANYCMEVIEDSKRKWTGEMISRFEANQSTYRAFSQNFPHFRSTSFSGSPLVMRLCNDDIIATGAGTSRQLLRVQKLSKGRVTLAAVNEANTDSRNRDKDDSFSFTTRSPNQLHKLGARRVFVDVLGNVLDPGPPCSN